MRKPRVRLVSTSRYPDKHVLRCQQLAQTATLAREAGYEFTVVDASEDPAIAAFLCAHGADIFTQATPGMAPSRREAFAHAKRLMLELSQPYDGKQILFWLEEKEYVVAAIPIIIEPIVAGEAVACIARRSEASYETWPWFQGQSERQANAVFNEVTGRASDPMQGPGAFLVEVADAFINARPEQYGVSAFAAGYVQHFGWLHLLARGLPVADSNPLDVTYSSKQRAEEESGSLDAMLEKRRLQMDELSEGYRVAARTLGIRRS